MEFAGLEQDFAREALTLLGQLELVLLQLETAKDPAALPEQTAAVLRLLHTLKGNAGLLGAAPLENAFHAMETLSGSLAQGGEPIVHLLSALDVTREKIRAVAQGEAADSSSRELEQIAKGFHLDRKTPFQLSDGWGPREENERLDALIRAAGHLMVQNGQLQTELSQPDREPASMRRIADALDAAVRSVHQLALEARSVPVGPLLTRFARLIREETQRAGKRATLRVVGERTEVDRALLEPLSEVLVHLVRNAVAHGIETPEVRAAQGKPEQGTITLSAVSLGSRVELSVADDGAGLDHVAIARRASGLRLSPAPSEQLIFEPGFSTAPLSSAAGRGVGLDIVKRSIERLGGTVDVFSEVGMCFRVRVPASLALERSFLFDMAGERFAIPIASVLSATRLAPERIRWLGRGLAMEHQGNWVPLLDESQLGLKATSGAYALILRGKGALGLRVDALRGQDSFVFHPLPDHVRGDGPVSSAALLGNGHLLLRLDPEVLNRRAAMSEAA